MSGYGQFCPVALALDVIGERWTLLVVRELMSGSRRFSEIQRGLPRCSRSVLTQRLKALVDGGVIEKVEGGYVLTPAGEELGPLVLACGEWGKRWAFRKLKNADVDVGLLMWDLRRRIVTSELPQADLWVEFVFRGATSGPRMYWLHLSRRGEADLCVTHPGRDPDLRVRTSPAVMGEIWMGERKIRECVRTGKVEIDGPKRLAREFPKWLELSVFAETPSVSARGS